MVSLVNQAKDGNIEDYLRSKQKDLKNFKENLLVFLDSLIFECHDRPLFDQVFMEKCIDYLISFYILPQGFFDRLQHWLDSSLWHRLFLLQKHLVDSVRLHNGNQILRKSKGKTALVWSHGIKHCLQCMKR